MKIQNVKIDDLRPFERNPKIHPESQLKKLEKSISEFGWTNPVLATKEGMIVAGHARVEAAKRLNLSEVPVIYLDMPYEKAIAYVVADNRLAELAETDVEKLSDILNELIEIPDFDIELTGFNLDEIGEIDLQLPTPETEEDDFDADKAIGEIDEPITKRGDVVLLGSHRLMCGDSTDAGDVKKLMDGKKADMVFTSPPYNGGSNSGTGGYRGNNKRDTKEFYNDYNDDMGKEAYYTFLINVLKNIHTITKHTSPVLWNVSYNAKSRDDYGRIIFSHENPFQVRETIVWDKGVGMNIAASGILSRTCEFIFLMSVDNKYYTNQGKHDTWWNVWRISNKDGDNMQNNHGASFPVKVVSEGLNKFSSTGNIVLDPFLGSGSTLIAAEQTNRICYGMELSEKYCDIIVHRWEEFTKKKAVRL